MPYDGSNFGNEANGDVPLFVRGQHNGGSGYHGHGSYDEHGSRQNGGGDDDHLAAELRECQLKVMEWNAKADEATQRNIRLEQDYETLAMKRMSLEQELNDVHRQHMNEMAEQKDEYALLKADFDKMKAMNIRLKDDLLRTNRELMGVLAKKNEFKKEAERAARSAITDENRAKAELHQQFNNAGGSAYNSHNNSASDLLGKNGNGIHQPDLQKLRNGTSTTPPSMILLGSRLDDPRTVRSTNALRDLCDFFDM